MTMRSQDITTTTTTPSPNRSSPQSVDGGGGGGTTNAPNRSKIQALKQRKSDLEKLLNEKNLMLQQIQRQEHHIIAGDYNYDHISRCNGAATLRRKIGTSFKMTTKNGFVASKELGGSVGEMEKKVRQEFLKESNAIKPITRSNKPDYELAQQKPINHGVNLAKNHRSQQHADPIAITLNLTKSSLGETSSLANGNKYGSNSSVNNNYYIGERRNSMKSMSQQHSPNSGHRNYDDSRTSTIALLKSHRSDYDLAAANRLLIVTPQNVGGYLYESGGGVNVMLDSNGYYTNNSNVKYATSPPMKGNSNRYSTIPNYYPPQPSDLQNDDALYLAQCATFNSGRNYQQYVGDLNNDSVSLSPSSTIGPFSPIHQQPSGLGGYWRMYGSERIWCTVDPSYDGVTQLNEKSNKSNTIAAPTKSLSLGNFDILTSSRDEMIDKISISSMNSDITKQKQQKEKQWLETSLDGPMVTTKHQQQLSASPISTSASYHHHVPPSQQSAPHQHHHHHTVQQLPPHSHHFHHYRDHRSKLSSQSISNPASSYHRIIPKIEDQQYLSQSTSMLHSSGGGDDGNDELQSSHPINYHHHYPKKQSPTPSQSMQQQQILLQRSASRIAATSPIPPPPPPQSSQLLKQQSQQTPINPRSPIIANLTQHHHDTIRIESPKNMTVIQQAVFMPYKEISKPFEMSDFYKYSTKFRQKDKQQQQQQQVEVEQ